MASSAASETIMFIAAIIVTTAVVGTLSVVVVQLSGDMEARGNLLSDELRTHITIINDPLAVDTTPNLEVYVKNTGAKALLTPDVSILVDGVFMDSTVTTFDVLDSANDDTWRPGEVLWISVSGQTFTGGTDYRIRVVTDNGIGDTFTFTA